MATLRNATPTILLLMTLAVLAAQSAAIAKRTVQPAANLGYASLPLAFEENLGQVNTSVKFLARGSGYVIFFTEKQAVLSLNRSPAGFQEPFSAAGLSGRNAPHGNAPIEVLHLQWVDANPAPRVERLGRETGRSNYLIGNNPAKWVRGVPAWSKVEYHGVYRGVDVVYYGNQRQLEFDIDVAPGADPGSVELKITGKNPGAEQIRVNRRGELMVHTRAGGVFFRKPRAYQPGGNSGDGKHFLGARYVIGEGGNVGFAVSGYDPAKPLVIDPVLSYSTYLGGTDYNYATGIAVDASGNTYITGYTSSVDFPVSGGVQGIFAGGSCDTEVDTAPCFDAFVSKLNPQGTGLIYSTYLGGTGDDRGVRIAVDGTGEAYVAGLTDSTDFPTAAPLQGSNGGGTCGTTAYPNPCYDAFVAKLSATGSSLVYSTYLGGTGDDFSSSIAVDSNGDAYIGGLTSASNFPVTYGALQTAYAGGPFDGFVAKINSSGTALVYATYLGGSQEDHVNGIALDSSGDAYLTGQTNSANFPSQGGFQPKYTATSCGSALSSFPCFESFVTELNPDGSSLVYSSYLGGTAASYGSSIALDSSGAAYVAGWTTSKDFPVTEGAFDTTWGGSSEAFVAKIAAAGKAIDYATYLGSINPDQANSIAVDGSGNAYVAGFAYGGKFPIASPLQATSGGFYDGTVSKLDAAGSTLLFSTYLGGTGDEAANDLALDSSGNIYIAGDTFSTDFPVTPSALTTGYTGGSYDAWIAKISPQNTAGLTAVPNPLVFSEQEINTTSAPSAFKIGNAGSAALSISQISLTGDFAETSQCGQTVSPATQCTISVTFTPTATGIRTGTVVLTDNAVGSPQTIKLSGYGTSGAASLSTTSLDFGLVVVGTTRTETVTLTNVAQSPLDISSIQAAGGFTESNNCGSVVSPGSSCSIAVSFSPSALGTSVGTVTITDTGPGSPQTITLTGTGATPPAAKLSPSSVTFGSQAVGTTSLAQTVTLSNTGGAPMTISSIAVTGDFAEINNCGGSLAPGTSCTVSVTFSPQQAGTATGTLAVSDNAAGSPQTASLSGNGVTSFTLAANQNSVTVLAGTDHAQFTVSVSSSNGFTGSVVLGCADVAPATCAFNPASIAPGQSSILTVGKLDAITSSSLNFTMTGTIATASQTSTASLTTSSSSTTTSSTSTATLPLSVQFANFTLAVSPAQATIQAGQAANYTLTLTPLNGFDMPVSLACSGVPADATCSFSSSTVQLDSSGPAQDTLTVSTASQSGLVPLPGPRRFPIDGSVFRWLAIWLWSLLPGLVLVGARKRQPSPTASVRNVIVTILLILALAACGGGGGSGPPGQNKGTPTGTYALKVTATAQSLSHTSQVTLQVN